MSSQFDKSGQKDGDKTTHRLRSCSWKKLGTSKESLFSKAIVSEGTVIYNLRIYIHVVFRGHLFYTLSSTFFESKRGHIHDAAHNPEWFRLQLARVPSRLRAPTRPTELSVRIDRKSSYYNAQRRSCPSTGLSHSILSHVTKFECDIGLGEANLQKGMNSIFQRMYRVK
jgi:hypothetical protein